MWSTELKEFLSILYRLQKKNELGKGVSIVYGYGELKKMCRC